MKLKNLIRCALFAALLCICSPISFAIGPVPISMGLFAVFLIGVVLPWYTAIGSVFVFYMVGFLLPVFAGGHTGVTALSGPTGGYAWSYILTALIVALFCKLPARKYITKVLWAFVGCILGTVVCYLCGTAQFVLITGNRVGAALALCVYPFIAIDIGKAICASLIGVQIKKILGDRL